MKQQRHLIFAFLLGFIIASILFICENLFIQQNKHSANNKETYETLKFQADNYYNRISSALNTSVSYKTIPSRLEPYIPCRFVQTNYSSANKQCYIFLDFYFTETEYNDWLKYKQCLFVYLDPNILWSNDKLSAHLLSKKENCFHRDQKLEVNADTSSSFSISLSQIKKEAFPCHLQICLEAPWNQDEMPQDIIYQYDIR